MPGARLNQAIPQFPPSAGDRVYVSSEGESGNSRSEVSATAISGDHFIFAVPRLANSLALPGNLFLRARLGIHYWEVLNYRLSLVITPLMTPVESYCDKAAQNDVRRALAFDERPVHQGAFSGELRFGQATGTRLPLCSRVMSRQSLARARVVAMLAWPVR